MSRLAGMRAACLAAEQQTRDHPPGARSRAHPSAEMASLYDKIFFSSANVNDDDDDDNEADLVMVGGVSEHSVDGTDIDSGGQKDAAHPHQGDSFATSQDCNKDAAGRGHNTSGIKDVLHRDTRGDCPTRFDKHPDAKFNKGANSPPIFEEPANKLTSGANFGWQVLLSAPTTGANGPKRDKYGAEGAKSEPLWQVMPHDVVTASYAGGNHGASEACDKNSIPASQSADQHVEIASFPPRGHVNYNDDDIKSEGGTAANRGTQREADACRDDDKGTGGDDKGTGHGQIGKETIRGAKSGGDSDKNTGLEEKQKQRNMILNLNAGHHADKNTDTSYGHGEKERNTIASRNGDDENEDDHGDDDLITLKHIVRHILGRGLLFDPESVEVT